MIEFGTAGIRGPVPERLDHRTAIDIGRAIGSALDLPARTAVVARDARPTGSSLAMGVTAGLTAIGIECAMAGQTATPLLAHASRGRLGVMVTASHNPPPDNGIKVFVDGRELRPSAERAVEEVLAEERFAQAPWGASGACRSVDALTGYVVDLHGVIRDVADDLGFDETEPLDGMHLAVDGGNGVAVEPLAEALRPVGATLHAINANPDGTAPARPSKPTPETLEGFAGWLSLLEDQIEVGFAFDGDGDRLVLLDGSGSVVHEDTVVAMLARELVRLAEVDRPVVVTTPNASARIDDAVADVGGSTERAPLGGLGAGIDRVEAHARSDERVVFAAEPWKHLIPHVGPWIDAIASACLIALFVRARGSIATLAEGIADPPYVKRSVDCNDGVKSTVMARLEDELEEVLPGGRVEATPDGYKLTFDRFEWLLVRPSGTEPRIRVYAEGERSVSDRLDTAVALLETIIDETRADRER